MGTTREDELMQQIAARDARIAQLAKEKKVLQERIDHLLRKIYGTKSEKADLQQLQLLMQELHSPGPAMGKESSPEASEIEPPARKKISRQRRAPELPKHLPVVEEILVPEAVRAAPEAYRRIGEEVSERLDFEPARFFMHRIVRPKYVRRQEADAVPIVAKLPPCILEGSILTPGLLAQDRGIDP